MCSAMGKGGLLALSKGLESEADIKPCADHKTAPGLLIDKKDMTGGGDATRDCHDYSLTA